LSYFPHFGILHQEKSGNRVLAMRLLFIDIDVGSFGHFHLFPILANPEWPDGEGGDIDIQLCSPELLQKGGQGSNPGRSHFHSNY
jgi:hypothetical protein